MRPLISDAQGRLLRAISSWLRARMDGVAHHGSPPAMVVEDMTSQAWASATFNGQQHQVTIRIEGIGRGVVDGLIAGLGEAELYVPGHVVADVALLEHRMHDDEGAQVHHLMLEVLTVAD